MAKSGYFGYLNLYYYPIEEAFKQLVGEAINGRNLYKYEDGLYYLGTSERGEHYLVYLGSIEEIKKKL